MASEFDRENRRSPIAFLCLISYSENAQKLFYASLMSYLFCLRTPIKQLNIFFAKSRKMSPNLNLPKILKNLIIFCIFCLILLPTTEVKASPLADRVAKFPNWQTKPTISLATDDLFYPNWMEGTWQVTSTLVDIVAPLAPDIVTPGFEGNRRYLNQPISFLVRFQETKENLPKIPKNYSIFPDFSAYNRAPKTLKLIVADREFNGLNIAKAILGHRSIISVTVNPENPNRQTTLLPNNLELVSVVTERGTEMPNPEEFIATEITQQIFEGTSQIYLNQVETTTDYRHLLSTEKIEADQITAVYLSPQDPDFFVANGRPVSLYRYRLELVLVNNR